MTNEARRHEAMKAATERVALAIIDAQHRTGESFGLKFKNAENTAILAEAVGVLTIGDLVRFMRWTRDKTGAPVDEEMASAAVQLILTALTGGLAEAIKSRIPGAIELAKSTKPIEEILREGRGTTQ